MFFGDSGQICLVFVVLLVKISIFLEYFLKGQSSFQKEINDSDICCTLLPSNKIHRKVTCVYVCAGGGVSTDLHLVPFTSRYLIHEPIFLTHFLTYLSQCLPTEPQYLRNATDRFAGENPIPRVTEMGQQIYRVHIIAPMHLFTAPYPIC